MDESAATFEFTEDQNALFGDLAGKMSLVGRVQMVFGGLVFIATLLTLANGEPTGLLTGTVMVLIGRWTVTASKGFQSVVDTSGSDVPHLMNALSELHKLFGLEYWIFLIGLGLLAAIMGLMLILGLFGLVS